MNCQEFTAVLDQSGAAALPDNASAHADACTDCGAALTALRALTEDPVPGVRPAFATALLDGFADATAAPARRLWRPATVIGVLGIGGLVFAGVGFFAPDAERVSGSSAPTGATQERNALTELLHPVQPSLIDAVEAAEEAAHREFADALIADGPLPDGEYFSVLKVGPIYPAEALERGLEGYAVLEFVITARGDVNDITIVESSDALFEAPAVWAAEQFKYKPRVADGRAVAVEGVRNKITFLLSYANAGIAPPGPEAEPTEAELARLAEFRRALAPALECLRVADLSCIELELDELAATLDLGASERAEIERIRGFVNFRRGNYQQAIDAYRAAAGDLAGDVFRHTTSLMVVARIHYELAQYQEALDAAVQYLRVAPNPSVSEYAFVDRLRQLGATVD